MILHRPKDASAKGWLLTIVALAILARLIFIVTNDPIPPPAQINLDEVDYNYLAMKFATGQGITDKFGEPTATRFPLYVIFLGAIYWIFGWETHAAFIIQALIGGLVPLIVYMIAREFFRRRISLIAASICALYPSFIVYSQKIMSENIFLPLLALLIFLTIRLHREYSIFNSALTGIILALLALTRGVAMPLMFIIPIWIFVVWHKQIRLSLRRSVLMILAMVFTLLPWTIRNYGTFHKIYPISTESGTVFWLGFNWMPVGDYFNIDRAYAYVNSVGRERAKIEVFHQILVEDNLFGYTGAREALKSYFPEAQFPQSETEFDKMMLEKTREQIKANPKILIIKTVREFLRFWHFLDDRGGYVFSYALILPFFLVGIWLLRQRIWELMPLLAFFLYTWALETTFTSGARYRMPFEIVMIVIAAFCIYEFFTLVKPVSVPIFLTAILLAVNLYLNFNVKVIRGAIRGAVSAVGLPVADDDRSFTPHFKGEDKAPQDSLKSP